jgi:hypothetical protein
VLCGAQNGGMLLEKIGAEVRFRGLCIQIYEIKYLDTFKGHCSESIELLHALHLAINAMKDTIDKRHLSARR